eukprot:3882264-Rhodomonas_salina.1
MALPSGRPPWSGPRGRTRRARGAGFPAADPARCVLVRLAASARQLGTREARPGPGPGRRDG